MAISTAQQPSVTLTLAQRDAVHEFIGHLLAADGNVLDMSRGQLEREFVIHASWRLSVGARILDQLGPEADGNRDSYSLELDDDIAKLMQEVGREASDTLRGDLRTDDHGVMLYPGAAVIDRAAVDAALSVAAAI
jgi:hypothetical protein